MQRLFCYIDETGQDTQGDFFIVVAIVLDKDRDKIEAELEDIERRTGKGKTKWIKSKPSSNQDYIHEVIEHPLLYGKMGYAEYRNSKKYLEHVASTTYLAISRFSEANYKATIVVDGLREGKEQNQFRKLIRDRNIRFKTIRGVKDETNSLIRLADALCGFIRDGLHDDPQFADMFVSVKEKGCILEL